MARTIRVLALATVVTLLALSIVQQGVPPAEAVFEDSDFDGAIDIAEEAAGSDPNDWQSIPETVGTEIVAGYFSCGDGFDNDLDGLIDDEDPGCTDTDGDTVADPVEASFYGSDPNDASSFPEDSRLDAILDYYGLPVVFCADTVDNDGDGLTDANDPGCVPIFNDGDEFDDFQEKRWGSDPGDPASVPEHETPNPGSCSDGIDNDLDGLTDADDPACASPDNDDRANATVIAALPYSDGPRLAKNATLETAEPEPSCIFGAPGGTIWYSYTAAADAVLIADTAGSTFPSSIAVWAENGALDEVACSLMFGFPSGSRVVFQVDAGTTYLFQIDGFLSGYSFPEVAFNLAAGVPPANDNFADATDVTSLPFEDSVDLSAALTERGEPASNCSGEADSTVWYTYTPAEDMLVLADTDGSDVVSIVSVWVDSVFGLTEVACRYPYGASQLPISVTAGKTYYIQVGRYPYSDLTAFDLQFRLQEGVPPANDDLADATSIGVLPFNEPIDLLTSTLETGEADPACLTYDELRGSVWFSYTATSDTILRADTTGGFYYGVAIGVYQGTSFDNLTSVACGVPWYPSARTAFEAVAGETYLLQVGQINTGAIFIDADSGSDASGSFPPPPIDEDITFNLTDLGYPDCPADQFSVADPVDDIVNNFFFPEDDVRHDITSVSGGSDGSLTCVTVDLVEPVDPPGAEGDRFAGLAIDVDVDVNPATGYRSSIDYTCQDPSGLGVETQMFLESGSGLLVPVYQFFDGPIPIDTLGFAPPPPLEQPYALALYGERSITIAIENDLVGGDDEFALALYVRNENNWATDCAPNGGHIVSPQPATSGDVNCDGRANSVDATLILQYFADLALGLPCLYLGDVNSNGGVGPLDALIILQYDAGLLDELPSIANSAVLAAVRATAELAQVFPGNVNLVSKEAQDWENSCLGLADPGEACLEVITPGYRIELEVTDGIALQTFVWRTNADGSELRLEGSSCEPCPPTI